MQQVSTCSKLVPNIIWSFGYLGLLFIQSVGFYLFGLMALSCFYPVHSTGETGDIYQYLQK